MDLVNKFIFYLGYPFVRYALICAALIALASAFLGVILVLKRYSYIANSLSNVAFASLSIATAIGFTQKLVLALPLTIFFALILLQGNNSKKIISDAAIAMVSVSALALGYLVMNVFRVGPNVSVDVCTTLFGSTSILTLTKTDVITSIVLSVLVILFFIYYYKEIYISIFDEDLASASGINVERLNTVLSLVVAVVITLAIRLVGSLLVAALIVFPAVSAMKLFHSFRKISIAAAIISLVSALGGAIFAILASTPVGSTIVVMNLVIFLIMTALGGVKRG